MKVVEYNKKAIQDGKYYKSMPTNNRKKEEFNAPSPFTFQQIVNHIEKQKLLSAKSEY